MASLMLVNPRRRKRRASTKARRRRNPARRRTHHVRRRRNPSIRHHARRAVSRVRSSSAVKGIGGQLMAGVYGAGGAVLLDIAMAKLPLPTMLKSGIGHTATKIAGAVGVAMLGKKFLKGSKGDALAIGTMACVLHDAAREFLAPHIAMADIGDMGDMGYYSPAYPVGMEANAPGFDGVGEYVEGMGEYVEGMGDVSF